MNDVHVEPTNPTPEIEQETLTGYVQPEFIIDRENYWTDVLDKSVWVVCGDERRAGDKAVADFKALAPEALPLDEGGLSVFGQQAGIAKIAATSLYVQYGPEAFVKAGGYPGVLEQVNRTMVAVKHKTKALPALHTDEAKEAQAHIEAGEDSDGNFCTHGSAATGCAYCMGVGATAGLIGGDQTVQSVARDNVSFVFGDDLYVDQIIEGQQAIVDEVGADYSFTRQDYAASQLPVMALVGTPHKAAKDTGLLWNNDIGSVRNSYAAAMDGKEFYAVEGPRVALLIRTILPEYDLAPELLMKVSLIEAAAVRLVLASHDVSGDATPDPKRIPIGVRGGSVTHALAAIAAQEEAA